MENDRWYKRIGWFLFFSAITLLIFFVIDVCVQRFIYHYDSNAIEASYVKDVYEFNEGDEIILNINTNAKKYTVDIWIDEVETPFVFENTKTLKLDFDSVGIDKMPAGTYHIKSTLIGKRFMVKKTEILIETTIVIR